MKIETRRGDSFWTLQIDLFSAKALVWIARVGTDGELSDATHLYFFDRYRRLAEHHRARGRLARARRLQEKADEHYRAGGGEGPPYAAAMAMPRPRRFVRIDAIGTRRPDGTERRQP